MTSGSLLGKANLHALKQPAPAMAAPMEETSIQGMGYALAFGIALTTLGKVILVFFQSGQASQWSVETDSLAFSIEVLPVDVNMATSFTSMVFMVIAICICAFAKTLPKQEKKTTIISIASSLLFIAILGVVTHFAPTHDDGANLQRNLELAGEEFVMYDKESSFVNNTFTGEFADEATKSFFLNHGLDSESDFNNAWGGFKASHSPVPMEGIVETAPVVSSNDGSEDASELMVENVVTGEVIKMSQVEFEALQKALETVNNSSVSQKVEGGE